MEAAPWFLRKKRQRDDLVSSLQCGEAEAAGQHVEAASGDPLSFLGKTYSRRTDF